MRQFLLPILALFFTGGTPAQNGKASFTSQDSAEFAKTIVSDNIQLVDVRTPREYAAGHIPGAVNIDAGDASFDRQASTLDKEKPVAVYCRSGARSKGAARRLAAQGYKVYELDRGIMNWNGRTER